MNTVQKVLMSQAKAKLINSFGMTEAQAHNFIIHTAMETRRSKLSIAAQILKEELE